MSDESAYQLLEGHFDRIYDLQNIGAIAGWDEAAMMPEGGGEVRGKGLATLASVVHDMLIDERMPEWLSDAAGDNSLDTWQRANLLEMRREYSHAILVPSDLRRRISLTSSKCEQAWRRYRAENNWKDLYPMLDELVGLVREEAQIKAEGLGCTPYQALVDAYEPDLKVETITHEFEKLKTFLPGFLNEVLASQSDRQPLPISGPFPIPRQRELGLKVMENMGFDFNRGRLDVSHHPFCGGVPDDTRITTRYVEESFVESLMGVIHETGHALYQQGLPGDWRNQPVGEARSNAVHESQSLIMEMQAGRTPEFVRYLTPMLQEVFLGATSADPAWQTENLIRHYHQVRPGFIRVDADEVTYPLHVILRFEIERDLINGLITTADIPEIWDSKMTAYLGLSTAGNYSDGCLQDVHWPAGLFGYFPSYTLGAMTAAQLFRSAGLQHPELLGQLQSGDFSVLVSWLRQHVHQRGCSVSAEKLVEDATGESLNSNYFIDHLKQRYLSA